MTTSTRARFGAPTRKLTPPRGSISAPTGSLRSSAVTVRSMPRRRTACRSVRGVLQSGRAAIDEGPRRALAADREPRRRGVDGVRLLRAGDVAGAARRDDPQAPRLDDDPRRLEL